MLFRCHILSVSPVFDPVRVLPVLLYAHMHSIHADDYSCLHIQYTVHVWQSVARWPGGQGGQLPPQLALKRGRQNDDRGAPAAKQITRNMF